MSMAGIVFFAVYSRTLLALSANFIVDNVYLVVSTLGVTVAMNSVYAVFPIEPYNNLVSTPPL